MKGEAIAFFFSFEDAEGGTCVDFSFSVLQHEMQTQWKDNFVKLFSQGIRLLFPLYTLEKLALLKKNKVSRHFLS